ncbi:hypothetical protein AAG906_022781 [Vitis piasezkii]
MMRQIRLQDGGLTWDDRDGIPAASLPAKFRMPDIERYNGIGCPKIHLRLYNTVMRAHGIDDAQLVALFPMSLSGAAQRWFASVEPSRLRTWEDVAREFSTRTDIDVSRRELEATRRGRGDLRSLVHAAFSVEEAIARGLWTDTTPSPDSKGKKLIGPFSRSGELLSLFHRRSLDYAQEPYIAQTSMQPRPPHPRAATHPPPRPYAQRPPRQFTPLGMTLTRAFEKLRDAGVIVPLAPRPLPHPIPTHFRSHEHCLYHRFGARSSVVQDSIMRSDLIDSGVVDLARPSVTTNPLPAHSTHAVPPPPGLQTWFCRHGYIILWIMMREWLDCLTMLLRQRSRHGASGFGSLHTTSGSRDD